jgi:arylsulfatase A-like enzyme
MKVNKVVAAVLFVAASSFGAEQSRPNVIFMLADDMGYSDVSCYGSTKVSTPNLDRLAAAGLQFTDFPGSAYSK